MYTLVNDINGQTVVPVTVAKADQMVENRYRPKSVVQILRDQFGEDFGKAIQHYINQFPEELWVYDSLKGKTGFSVFNYNISTINIPVDQPIHDVTVMLVLDVMLILEEEERILYPIQMEMMYHLDLRPCSRSCKGPTMKVIKPGIKYVVKGSIANDYLLPYMKNGDYEATANEMLMRFYPEALETDLPVDGQVLASRMGLKISEVTLPPESTIMGCLFFSPTTVKLLNEKTGRYEKRTLNPGDIIINKNHCRNYSDYNQTVLHECNHFYLHRLFYMMQMLAMPKMSFHVHRKVEKTKRKFNQKMTPEQWMELQASKMPAYLLMPAEPTKAHIQRTYERLSAYNSLWRTRKTIQDLSENYKVSKSMAKYRMIELGYQEAEGIFSFVNNRRIPDYGCSGEWPKGSTFVISLEDAVSLYQEDQEFAKRMDSGKYVYVEGHFCIRNSKYLIRSRSGEYTLTDYARTHINECCLAFRAHGSGASATYDPRVAARKKKEPVKDKYLCKYEFLAEPGTDAEMDEFERIAEDAKRWGELEMSLSCDFSEAIDQIMEVKNISKTEISDRMNKDRKSIYDLQHAVYPRTKNVVAFCMALEVPFTISLKLLAAAGCSLRNTKEETLYKIMLSNVGNFSLEKCNGLLKSQGFDPLTAELK